MATSLSLRKAKKQGRNLQSKPVELSFGEKSKMANLMVKQEIAPTLKEAWKMIKDGYILPGE